MIALLDAASWFFQASHWATSRAEIASVNSGIETLCAISMSVPFVRSFWAATNCALRNGDAHLKNFGVVYYDALGETRLAPVYDLVTTAIYLPKDSLALTLNGTTQWPDSEVLRRLGETRMTGTPAKIRAILERISDALSQTEIDLRSYIKEHPDFKEVGERILQEWVKGRQLSLQPG